ncbi:hypothetical protein L7F22_010702 [Adiantum nelumboides]|nr:hypothetical protein [Adiantum nelumboides]
MLRHTLNPPSSSLLARVPPPHRCNFFSTASTFSARRLWRQSLIIMQSSGHGSPGEEPPESLFMKELKRRGLSKRSEEDESRSGLGTETKVDTGEVKSGPQTNSQQRKQSMALNSEGLEGLIPRAQSLLSLGGGFFLAFWPLIVASVAVFVALYFYYGPTFIHSGERVLYNQPSYVDPYELLENERIPPEAGPSFVPFNKR